MPQLKTSKVLAKGKRANIAASAPPQPRAEPSQNLTLALPSENLSEPDLVKIPPLSDSELVWVLEQISVLRAWASAVEAEALTRLLRGRGLPGYKLVEGRANRAWSSESNAEKALLEFGLPIDEVAPRSLVSVAQAEKVIKKMKRASEWPIIAPLVTRPRGKPSIAPEDDPRPVWHRGEEFDPQLETETE